jgi:hypothetical protein
VIKSMVVQAYNGAQRISRNSIDEPSVASANRFLQNLRGVVNYAVPHNGSFLESYFTLGHNLFRQVKLAGFMKNLQPFARQMEYLSADFDKILHKKSINVYAFLENKPVKDLHQHKGVQDDIGTHWKIVITSQFASLLISPIQAIHCLWPS